ncbi:MAG: hypothetical protein INQ03_07810 [Candidatus Heimdallarchaeota archaeon]|nr:hypothetical protein [Candidatus Heimdallarchaeota archaeon]
MAKLLDFSTCVTFKTTMVNIVDQATNKASFTEMIQFLNSATSITNRAFMVYESNSTTTCTGWTHMPLGLWFTTFLTQHTLMEDIQDSTTLVAYWADMAHSENISTGEAGGTDMYTVFELPTILTGIQWFHQFHPHIYPLKRFQ